MKNFSSRILYLIAAYTSKEISKKEFQELKQFLEKDPENKQSFVEYLHFYKKARRSSFVENFDKDKSWNDIVNKVEKPLQQVISSKKNQQKVKYLGLSLNIFKYAAIVFLFLGLGYIYQKGFFSNKSNLVIPTESITLQLENGNIEIINENGTSQIVDKKGNVVGKQDGRQLVYSDKSEKETLIYNTLTVPYGKRFEVQLSDGTHVYLNAGTSLKYPVNFIEGENRQVFLKGEAYFNVKKDTKHPFIVNANEIDIRVLGTQFNVSSYPEDKSINTVLVEGSVSIYKENTNYNETATYLKPGFKAAWQKNSDEVYVEEADIEMHTAWINGRIIFRHLPFNSIIKKLERHYNVTINNNNELLGNELISASFDIEKIEDVFRAINGIHPIDYIIENNKIIIK